MAVVGTSTITVLIIYLFVYLTTEEKKGLNTVLSMERTAVGYDLFVKLYDLNVVTDFVFMKEGRG